MSPIVPKFKEGSVQEQLPGFGRRRQQTESNNSEVCVSSARFSKGESFESTRYSVASGFVELLLLVETTGMSLAARNRTVGFRSPHIHTLTFQIFVSNTKPPVRGILQVATR